MLSKHELEEIIKAWPDEDGNSTNPEIYNNWIELERDHCRSRIRHALGTAKIEALSDKQYRLLENALEKLFARKSHWEITDKEILGQYEIVTEHISTLSMERAVEEYHRRRKMN